MPRAENVGVGNEARWTVNQQPTALRINEHFAEQLLTWLSDQNLRETWRVPGESIPGSIWVTQPFFHQAVVCPRITGFCPVQRQHIEPGWQPLRLHSAPQSLLICIGAILDGPWAFNSQQELIVIWPSCASHIPQHGMLGVLACLRGNGAVDPDTTILQVHLRLVGLLDS